MMMICSICQHKKENEDLRRHIRDLETEISELRADLKWAEEDVDHTMEMLANRPHLRKYERILRNVFS